MENSFVIDAISVKETAGHNVSNLFLQHYLNTKMRRTNLTLERKNLLTSINLVTWDLFYRNIVAQYYILLLFH